MDRSRSFIRIILGGFIILSTLLSSCSGGGKGVTIGYGSDIDPADVADRVGIDIFAQNHKVNVVSLMEDSGVVAGIIKGDVKIANIGAPDTVKAIQMGVPLKIIMPANMVMEYVLIGQPGIKTVADLKGKKVAYHGPGSGTEILPRLLVRNSGVITENDVEWVILPESPNRAAAMQAKRIDVTALEYADVVTLQESGTNYEYIATFADVAPEAIASVWVTTEDYAKQNPQVVNDLAVSLAKGYAEVYADKNVWMTTAKKLLPQVDESRLSKAYDFYASVNNFPKSPYLSEEMWKKMDAFYTSIGEYGDSAPYSLVLTEPIKAALAAVKQ